MPDIKTRDVVKGTVKVIDKSAVAAERMKDAYVRTKDKAEHGVFAAESSPEEYAADRTLTGTETAAHEAAHGLDKAGRKGVKTTKENISKAKDYFQRRKADLPKKQTKDAMRRVRRSADTTQKAIKTVDRSGKTIKQTAKSTGQAAVKTTQKSIKTAEQTSRTAIKTTQAAAKTAQKTAQATAKAAKTAAQTARAAAKATAAGIKAAVKAIAAAVKAIVAGTKALIAAIAAGGWIAVVVIIVICLIGLIVGSCFGIFFSGEDSGTGQTMRQAVQEINADYQSQIDTTRATIIYDELEMSGSRAVWPEVLAVYAVKTTTDPNDPQEVATVDDAKKAILKDIFWRMNELSSRTESKARGRSSPKPTTATGTSWKPPQRSHAPTFILRSATRPPKKWQTVSTSTPISGSSSLNCLPRKTVSMWSAVLYGIYVRGRRYRHGGLVAGRQCGRSALLVMVRL